jgi:hypothetical protein
MQGKLVEIAGQPLRLPQALLTMAGGAPDLQFPEKELFSEDDIQLRLQALL